MGNVRPASMGGRLIRIRGAGRWGLGRGSFDSFAQFIHELEPLVGVLQLVSFQTIARVEGIVRVVVVVGDSMQSTLARWRCRSKRWGTLRSKVSDNLNSAL